MELVRKIYALTQTFPKEEMFGLTSQIRRAAVSIPSNIAEGAARTGTKEFAQFLNISRGSLSELETQLLIAADLGYIKNDNPVPEEHSVYVHQAALISRKPAPRDMAAEREHWIVRMPCSV